MGLQAIATLSTSTAQSQLLIELPHHQHRSIKCSSKRWFFDLGVTSVHKNVESHNSVELVKTKRTEMVASTYIMFDEDL